MRVSVGLCCRGKTGAKRSGDGRELGHAHGRGLHSSTSLLKGLGFPSPLLNKLRGISGETNFGGLTTREGTEIGRPGVFTLVHFSAQCKHFFVGHVGYMQ